MCDLVVVGFEDEHAAFERRASLARLRKQCPVDMKDVVVVTRNENGRVKLHLGFHRMGARDGEYGFWGTLINGIVSNSLQGEIIDDGAGAIPNALSELGISGGFARELAQTLLPKTSALFILMRKTTPDTVLNAVSTFSRKVVRISLAKKNADNLPGERSERDAKRTGNPRMTIPTDNDRGRQERHRDDAIENPPGFRFSPVCGTVGWVGNPPAIGLAG